MATVLNQQLELVDVDKLTEHPDNPRQGQVDAITESIETNGFFGACLVQRSSGHILVGNHRYRSAVQAGLPTVPVLWVDVDDARAKRIMVADNRAAELATWDEQALSALLTELQGEPDGLAGSLYSEDDVASLLSDTNGTSPGDGSLLEAADVSIADPRHQVEAGQVWRLGSHVLVVADVLTGWPEWQPHLADGAIFVPYASPFAPLSERAQDTPLVCVQPNHYLAAHLLDKWEATTGQAPRKVNE